MQLFRLLSAQPQADGESWKIRGQFHQDQWYEDAYGQNPVPFQQQAHGSGRSIPYPWRPGVQIAAFSSQRLGFELEVDTTVYPAQISASGSTPVNVPNSTTVPAVPLQATTSNTGGLILPGTYLIAISANGTLGPVSRFVTAVVPAGTSTNTITVSGVVWPAAAVNVAAYAGPNSIAMVYQGALATTSNVTGSAPDSFGNPTSFTFFAISPDGLGLPDDSFHAFAVQQTEIVHGGVWGAVVGVVTPHTTTSDIKFPGAAWTSNQWQNYTVSLYYRPGGVVQPLIDLVVVSNSTDTLTVPKGVHVPAFIAGDVVIMRPLAGHTSANTIGDDNFISSFNPSGLTVNAEAGNLVQIIAGTGAWSAAKTVASNTATVLTILSTWDVMPDSTSIFIVLSPTSLTSITASVLNDGSVATYGLVASVPAATTQAQSLLIQIGAANAAGDFFPMRYQPFREVYIPAQATASNFTIARQF